MRVRTLSFVLGLLALVGAGCDFCFPSGGPDPPPDQYLMGLDVQMESGGTALNLRRAPVLAKEGASAYADTLDRHDVHVDPQGQRALIGRTVYSISDAGRRLSEVPEDPGMPLPDSLKSCTFAHQRSDLVCGVVARDTLVHPETGRRLPVRAARARLALLSAPSALRKTLRTAHAEFTGPFDYRSTRFTAPALSLDDQRIAVVRRVEKRHLVRDSSGAIVDDVVQRVDRTLIVFDRSQPGTLRRTIALPSGVDRRSWVALAPGGEHVAVEIDDVIRYAPVEGGSVQQVEGTVPRFTGSGEHMVVAAGFEGMTIYDLGSGATQSVSNVSAFSPHPRSNRIYYVTADTLKVADASSRTTSVAGALKPRLIEQLDDEVSSDFEATYGLRIYHLAPLLDDRRLMPFGILERRLYRKGGC